RNLGVLRTAKIHDGDCNLDRMRWRIVKRNTKVPSVRLPRWKIGEEDGIAAFHTGCSAERNRTGERADLHAADLSRKDGPVMVELGIALSAPAWGELSMVVYHKDSQGRNDAYLPTVTTLSSARAASGACGLSPPSILRTPSARSSSALAFLR